MFGYLSAVIICSKKRTRERSSRKIVSFGELIMSKDKYPNIFSPQMEATVFLQTFSATREVLKIGEYSRTWNIGLMTCLDQSRASENI